MMYTYIKSEYRPTLVGTVRLLWDEASNAECIIITTCYLDTFMVFTLLDHTKTSLCTQP